MSRRSWRHRGRRTTSTPRGWSGCSPGPPRTAARECSPRVRRRPAARLRAVRGRRRRRGAGRGIRMSSCKTSRIRPSCGVQAWAVGPGIGTDDAARALLADVLSSDRCRWSSTPTASRCSPRTRRLLKGRAAATVLTPHDREFARIASGPSDDRLGSARAAASALAATVLLKGTRPSSRRRTAGRGSTAPARRGSPPRGTGDVLTGLIGALLASGLEPPVAAAAGAFVHGVAGQLAAADGPPTSVDVLGSLRRALRLVAGGG